MCVCNCACSHRYKRTNDRYMWTTYDSLKHNQHQHFSLCRVYVSYIFHFGFLSQRVSGIRCGAIGCYVSPMVTDFLRAYSFTFIRTTGFFPFRLHFTFFFNGIYRYSSFSFASTIGTFNFLASNPCSSYYFCAKFFILNRTSTSPTARPF